MNYTLSSGPAFGGKKPQAKRTLRAGLQKFEPFMRDEKAGFIRALIAILVNSGALSASHRS